MDTFDLKKFLIENKKSINENFGSEEQIDNFIQGLQSTIEQAQKLKEGGSNEMMDFGSLVDATRDWLREFES